MAHRSSRGWFVLALAAGALLVAAAGPRDVAAAGQEAAGTEEGGPVSEGERLFKLKGCADCHTVWGKGPGAGIGPDLGGKAASWADVMRLAGAMWNHTPTMAANAEQHHLQRPTFSAAEMSRLVTYLFFLKFVGPAGDPGRGREAFESRLCSRCHQFAGRGGTTGPRLDELKDYATAFLLARSLWNHGPDMANKADELGLVRPQLRGADIADMVAMISGQGAVHGEREIEYMQAGTPRDGELLFERLGCDRCHPSAGQTGASGPDLSRPDPDFDVAVLAAAFWNHGPTMWAAMKKAGLTAPRFSDDDMADLLAYLAFIRYTGRPGDAARGAEVFRQKSCATCHAPGGKGEAAAPDLATADVTRSASTWMAAMWNHAPSMQASLREKDLAWPRFEADEMRDLVEYLRSRAAAGKEKP